MFYLSIAITVISIFFCSTVGGFNFPLSVKCFKIYRINHGSEKKVCCRPKILALCRCDGVLSRTALIKPFLIRQSSSQCFSLILPPTASSSALISGFSKITQRGTIFISPFSFSTEIYPRSARRAYSAADSSAKLTHTVIILGLRRIKIHHICRANIMSAVRSDGCRFLKRNRLFEQILTAVRCDVRDQRPKQKVFVLRRIGSHGNITVFSAPNAVVL